jgi:hypothetical protein
MSNKNKSKYYSKSNSNYSNSNSNANYSNSNASGNYSKPNKTYQETLSKDDIKEQLKNYKLVDDINIVPIGTHLRYIIIDPKTKESKFRLGGSLSKFGDNREYIMMTNGTLTWSVQLKNTTFYRKLTENESKNELKKELQKEILSEMDNKPELVKENEKLLKKISRMEESYDLLQSKYVLLQKQLEDIKQEIIKEKKSKK